jgi:hypothetical protein
VAAHAALVGRDLDGDAATFEAYYDTALNIAWLADAGGISGDGDVSAVPEPAAAGMMVLGLLAVGAAVRRRPGGRAMFLDRVRRR